MHLYITRNPSGFNYGFRPTSYFDNLNPTTLIAASILGEERRKDLLERIASGDFDPVVWGEWITESKLDDSTLQQIGAAHPAFMGGEYLPTFDGEEIEIARVVLASVTQDVISIRASRNGDRIKYRVVDEYEAKFTLTKDWSFKPLTFAELIHLIDGAQHEDDEHTGGAVFSHVHYHCIDLVDFESIRTFIDVSSSFYPEVTRYYEHVIAEYLDEVTPVDEDEIEEDA